MWDKKKKKNSDQRVGLYFQLQTKRVFCRNFFLFEDHFFMPIIFFALTLRPSSVLPKQISSIIEIDIHGSAWV
jgi:hypothetical protein